MKPQGYDVIVVGTRCAGAPAAMLLARRGYRVLAVDRARFPSDTVSTHLVHPPGIAALRRWGVLDRVTATGCPPIDTYVFDFGAFALSGSPGTPEAPFAYAPRRTELDTILVEAASHSGAEIRQGFTVDEICVEDGTVVGVRGRRGDGRPVTERARVVVGADGRHSVVAKTTRPEQYDDKPPLLAGYYTYFSGLPMDGRTESYVRPNRGMAAWPTSGGLTVVIAGWPYTEHDANRGDIERHYFEALGLAPAFAARVRAARREAKFVGTAVPNYFRKPYGPGWALVGDAGYNRDFITAQGIHDAFLDAELLAAALDEALSGERAFDAAMQAYQSARDARVRSMYELTTQLATLEPPPPELQRLLEAMQGNQEAMDGFMRMNAGVIPPCAFFAPENIGRMLAGAS